jgi:hypothetical protein
MHLPRHGLGSTRARVAAALLLAVVAPSPLWTAARAQSAPGAATAAAPAPDGPFDDMMRALNLKAKIAPAPDFVVKSRRPPGKVDYLPVGTKHPDRPVKVLTPAEVAATETDLDAARVAQQRRAGIKPAPVPEKTKKAAAKPIPKTLR